MSPSVSFALQPFERHRPQDYFQMGYQMASGRWADTDPVNLHDSAARTTTGTTTALELGDAAVLRLDLTCSARSGTTPTLDVAVETSADGTTWRAVASFAQMTNTGTERKSFSGCDRFVRLSYTIAGTTPSFTFAVSGEAC